MNPHQWSLVKQIGFKSWKWFLESAQSKAKRDGVINPKLQFQAVFRKIRFICVLTLANIMQEWTIWDKGTTLKK